LFKNFLYSSRERFYDDKFHDLVHKYLPANPAKFISRPYGTLLNYDALTLPIFSPYGILKSILQSD